MITQEIGWFFFILIKKAAFHTAEWKWRQHKINECPLINDQTLKKHSFNSFFPHNPLKFAHFDWHSSISLNIFPQSSSFTKTTMNLILKNVLKRTQAIQLKKINKLSLIYRRLKEAILWCMHVKCLIVNFSGTKLETWFT